MTKKVMSLKNFFMISLLIYYNLIDFFFSIKKCANLRKKI